MMPVTMKNMKQQTIWIFSHLQLASFQSFFSANNTVALTWILHMELTKYEWPAIKYLKS
jgi:hypothetical protein